MTELIEYILFLALLRAARLLSFRSSGALGELLGSAAFRCTGFRKAITLDNLSHAFPGKTDRELRTIALAAYRNYGRAILEMLWAGEATEANLRETVRLKNPEIFFEALARGKGLILLAGHYGSWEMLVTGLRVRLGVPFTMIVQHQRNSRIDSLVNRNRSRFGNTTIPMGPSVREVLRALQQGRVVVVLGDQSGPREAVFVEFFGRPAATHRGAAAFSLRTGAPIVMATLIRQPDGIWEAVFEEIDRGGLVDSSEESILELTRRHTAVMEKYIRLHPDHWLWMHKRWKHTGAFDSHTGRQVPAATGHGVQ